MNPQDNITPVYYPIEEQETTIQISRDSSLAHIYCSDNTMLTKFKKLLNSNPKDWKCTPVLDSQGNPTGYFITCPKSLISFREKATTRAITPEQREALVQRMKNLHKS